MPACGQCGKDNPEGTAFCGYCAAPLMSRSAIPVRSRRSRVAGRLSRLRYAEDLLRRRRRPSRPSRKFARPLQAPPSSGGGGKGKGGFELLPWSELSSGQRAGRVVAGAIVLFLIFFFLRGMLRGLGGSGGRAARALCAMGVERSDYRRRPQRRNRIAVQGISDLRAAQERQRRDRSGTQRGVNCSNSPAISRPSAATTS